MKLLAMLLMTLPLFVACSSKGRLERAGANADHVIDDVRGGIKDAIDDVKKK